MSYNIIQNINEINSNRRHIVSDLLKEVARKQIHLHGIPYGSRYVLAISEKSQTLDKDFREWRFDTEISNITCSYHEMWEPIEKGNYFLFRAYFHIYKDGKEYLLLHCDPNEVENPAALNQYLYKRSPHLHVSVAEQPIPHSHIALNNSTLEHVLSSIDNFNQVMKTHIEMMKLEFIDKLK